MTDGEVIDRIERAELFAKKLRGVIEVVAAGPCADAQAAGLRRIATRFVTPEWAKRVTC